jgi:hypothetical protein
LNYEPLKFGLTKSWKKKRHRPWPVLPPPNKAVDPGRKTKRRNNQPVEGSDSVRGRVRRQSETRNGTEATERADVAGDQRRIRSRACFAVSKGTAHELDGRRNQFIPPNMGAQERDARAEGTREAVVSSKRRRSGRPCGGAGPDFMNSLIIFIIHTCYYNKVFIRDFILK